MDLFRYVFFFFETKSHFAVQAASLSLPCAGIHVSPRTSASRPASFSLEYGFPLRAEDLLSGQQVAVASMDLTM